MYRGKIKTWIAMILLSVIIFNFSTIRTTTINVITDIEKSLPQGTQSYNVLMAVNEQSLISKIEGYKKSGVKLYNTSTTNDADIIIANTSDDTIDNYTKYSEQFYSPIVMCVPMSAYKENNVPGFKKKSSSSSSHNYIEKDLYTFLEALEEGKTWEDIGLKKYFGSGDVKITIPKKGAENYEIICDFIKFTLNGYSFNDFDNVELNERTNKIIAKCDVYEDATQYITTICDAGKKGINACVLLPEYLLTESYFIAGASNASYSYVVCYTPKTMCIYYDLFIKNIDDARFSQSILTSLSQKKFLSEIGLRNVDATFATYDADNFYYASPFIVAVKE